ncbi:MAG: sugar transferase [Mucilaginibacter polytrichastri]|nr:sugar transferase [Mucilaginibacter polytrichastri]
MNPVDWQSSNKINLKVAYSGEELQKLGLDELNQQFIIHATRSHEELNEYLTGQSLFTLPDVILVQIKGPETFAFIESIKKNTLLKGLIIVLLSSDKNMEWRSRAKAMMVHDFYSGSFSADDITERLQFLIKAKLIKPSLVDLSEQVNVTYKMPLSKRVFDVVFSSLALFFLSPVLLLIAIVIRLESRGSVIYKSKRVGTGYKIFDFYKFRSMRADAELQLVQLSAANNQYAGKADDGGAKTAFVKIKNDPRVTTVGNFLRNTSLDEIPQLFNVLIGDMSLVGNRPLPLYEAEQLTSNEWSHRFLGPAGLTGLWQISRRGKEDMSERERKKLDNFYASKYSFWLDIKILVGTFPALIQKEKV